MNDLEARRHLLADPHQLTPELSEALSREARLAALRDELAANDEAMRRVLTETPVPEGLADRIVLRARYGERPLRRQLAIAATVAALSLAIPAFIAMRAPDAEQSRELAMIEHVATSREESADHGPIEPAAFRASVGALGVDVRAGGYRVAQLGRCVIAGIESRHFTVQNAGALISYVILPGATGDDGERMVKRHGLEGLFVQRSGATIGVFAREGTSRDDLRSMLHQVVG